MDFFRHGINKSRLTPAPLKNNKRYFFDLHSFGTASSKVLAIFVGNENKGDN